MSRSTQQKENLAVYYGTKAAYCSAHSADPGTTGASEIAGTRTAVTWTAGSVDGTVTATVTLNIPSGATVAGIGLWDAATAGTYLDGGTVTSQSFSASGTYTITLTYSQT